MVFSCCAGWVQCMARKTPKAHEPLLAGNVVHHKRLQTLYDLSHDEAVLFEYGQGDEAVGSPFVWLEHR